MENPAKDEGSGSGAAPSSRVGQTIGNYSVLEKLGAGGMGVVYKAQDLRLARTVALKFLPVDLETPDRAQSLFLEEARAASALDQPNIGTLHAIEATGDGALFLVMAYYEGDTLAQRIRRGPMPVAQAVSIAIQIARGLAEAHEHRIAHRDIKPSNVMMTTQGLAKIVDFGLARAMHSASSTRTATGATADGRRAVGSAADCLSSPG
jgi:serine/threonine protein kinase